LPTSYDAFGLIRITVQEYRVMSVRSTDSSLYATQRADYADQREDSGESISILDRFSNFDGTFHSSRDLRIEGQAKGTIECQGTLHIAQGATIDAKVDAENITVAGDLDGEITCRGRLQILPSGRVRGKINTVTLVIHEGAFYEGQLDMATPERQLSSGRRTRAGLGTTERSSSLPGLTTSEDLARTDDAREVRSEPSSTTSAAANNTFIRRFGGQETTWDTTAPAEEGDDVPR